MCRHLHSIAASGPKSSTGENTWTPQRAHAQGQPDPTRWSPRTGQPFPSPRSHSVGTATRRAGPAASAHEQGTRGSPSSPPYHMIAMPALGGWARPYTISTKRCS